MRKLLFIFLLISSIARAQVNYVIADRVLTPDMVGDTIQVRFAVHNFYAITAYQFALRFDLSTLSLAAISLPDPKPIPLSNLAGGYFIEADDTLYFPQCIVGDFGLCTPGEIRTVYTDPNGATTYDGAHTFSLHFEVKKSDTLSNALTLAPDVLPSGAWTFPLTTVGLNVFYTELPNQITGTDTPKSDFVRIFPNPFPEYFTLNQSGVLRVSDTSGQVVIFGRYRAGEQVGGSLSPGLYFGQIGSQTFKILKQ